MSWLIDSSHSFFVIIALLCAVQKVTLPAGGAKNVAVVKFKKKR